jgi:lipoprotein NlpD
VNFKRAIAVAGVCCFIIGGCASSGAELPASAIPSRPPTYVVRPQDTLYGIAWRHNLDYRELAKWNNIGPDYKLAIGQVLVLQPSGRAAVRVPSQSGAAVPRQSVAQTPAPAHAPAPAGQPATTSQGRSTGIPSVGIPQALDQSFAMTSPRTSASPSTGTGPVEPLGVEPRSNDARGAETNSSVANLGRGTWVWPTDRGSAPRPVPGGGILLLGKLGQDVRAAGSGRVVYIGSGLRGYGNLIIIKHDNNVLSSYAHNREMLVHEGQDVAAGQIIGHMGMGPHQISALYFEIRLNGKPVDPMPYMPQR